MSRVIIFEGIDGCGKDTQINKLIDYCKNNNKEYFVLYSLDNSIISQEIRKLLKQPDEFHQQLTCLFIAQLYNNVKCIRDQKVLERTDYIFVNRWIYSTMAYNARTLVEANAINVLSSKYLNDADIVFLDIPVDVALARIENRSDKSKDTFEKKEELERITGNYATIFSLPKLKEKLHMIDANRSVDDIHKDILAIIE